MEIRGVLMDLDGVLLDSYREGLRRIHILCAIHDVQYGRSTRSTLQNIWGAPGIELLMQGLDINRLLAERMYVDWEKMDKTDPPKLIPGAREALVWLRRNGFKMAVITSRHRKNACDVLDRHDLLNEFAIVTAREDVGPYIKPDPRVFRSTLEHFEEEFGITREYCIYVGDTASDIQAGQNAELETLVSMTGPYRWEHAREHPVADENILLSIDELPYWIEKYHDGELRELYQ